MTRATIRVSLVIAITSTLGACIALPTPPFYVSARRNIEDVVPVFIVQGETTRAEVLLKLGLPDIVTDDQSEFIYLVVRSRAGVWVSYGWREYTFAKVEYRKLELRFDERALVASAAVATGLCTESEDSATCGRVVITENGEPRLSE